MTNMETLKKYSTDFYPTKEDIIVAYSVLNFYKNQVKDISNLGVCFKNVSHYLERQYTKLKV